MTQHEIVEKVSLATEACADCGVTFAMPAQLMAQLRKTGGNFYCPSGHSMHYKSETDRLRKLLTEQTRFATEMADKAKTAAIKMHAVQADMNRLKKRAAAGTCPCCHRTVQQMARHMKTKHPEYETKST